MVLPDESVGFIPYYSAIGVVFRLVSKIANSDYCLRHFCSSVRHAFEWNNSAPTGWILMTFEIRVFLEKKTVEKIQVSLESNKKSRTLHEDQYTFLIISRSVLLRMSNVSDRICRGNQKTLCFQ